MAAERPAAGLLFVAILTACGSDDQPAPAGPAAIDKTALLSLRYDSGPPPADPSNRFSDDPAARDLGQRLFFDASFSGPLLEGDHDGLTVASIDIRRLREERAARAIEASPSTGLLPAAPAVDAAPSTLRMPDGSLEPTAPV